MKRDYEQYKRNKELRQKEKQINPFQLKRKKIPHVKYKRQQENKLQM